MGERVDSPQREGGFQILLDVFREVAKNTALGVPQIRRWRFTKPRAGRLYYGRDDELERWAFLPLRNLLEVNRSVKGLDILEIGPGDFMTSGFSLLAAGAKSYSVIDRDIGHYEMPEAKVWYKGIMDEWSRFFPNLPWPDYLRAEDFPEGYSDRVEILNGTIEEAQSPKQYDIVCSYQVGEHVRDIDAFARANVKFLKPNGVAVHRVDFGPHDCWGHYKDQLVFLRFPDWLWNLMGSRRGIPNRLRYHQVCAAIENAGLKLEVMGLERFPEQTLAQVRRVKKIEGIPSESLEIGTAVFVCRL